MLFDAFANAMSVSSMIDRSAGFGPHAGIQPDLLPLSRHGPPKLTPVSGFSRLGPLLDLQVRRASNDSERSVNPFELRDPTFLNVRYVAPEPLCKIEEARTRLHIAILVNDQSGNHPTSRTVLLFRNLAEEMKKANIVGLKTDFIDTGGVSDH